MDILCSTSLMMFFISWVLQTFLLQQVQFQAISTTIANRNRISKTSIHYFGKQTFTDVRILRLPIMAISHWLPVLRWLIEQLEDNQETLLWNDVSALVSQKEARVMLLRCFDPGQALCFVEKSSSVARSSLRVDCCQFGGQMQVNSWLTPSITGNLTHF